MISKLFKSIPVWLEFTAALLISTTALPADSFQFSLVPENGSVAGSPGTSVGWGYSITNQSSADWLVTTDLTADPFLHGTPTLLFDFPTIAPGQTITEPFDANTAAGLYELTWDSGAPDGFVNTGSFVLSAQWWDGDPLSGGAEIAAAPDASAAYSATASAVVNNAPEPSAWLMVGSGLIVLMRLRRRLKRAVV
jgi:hypothetical protein